MTPADTPNTTADEVDDAGRDSFPASDAPTWWAGKDRHPTKQQEEKS